ncbi:flagellar hook protein FlgE [Methylomarinovum tepidoasis]|uniref:Flagellar hook protein FlgE n=1 Tax=Methylomarinovum tepidoasis TaxID=2840183 RepID=A0AAU9C558_9GAMM|nr:flagellar hook protein FlgE [Methylomarinovum sp. IN45]BCX88647.1 flagellar hook protein FlgE [Methylomarinovum sp. IN45]
MSFSTALSGLNAASTDLQTTGNNIANANTVGFKKSRAEFADVYASSFFGSGKTTPGSGVRVTEVAQIHSQGNLEYTENVLDIAISGRGFFSLTDTPNGEPTAFTRNGAFQLDKNGYIVTDQGKYLFGWRADFSQGALKVETTKGKPQATDEVKLNVNLDSADSIPAITPFDPTKPESYNKATSVTVYDSLGNPHTITSYFVTQNPTTPNTWDVYQYIDGASLGGPTTLEFNTNGALISVGGTTGVTKATYPPYSITGADPLTITYDFADSTQFNSDFSINAMSQNGFPAGDFTGLEISDDGILFARFSNGNAEKLGQIALARFQNEQGLTKLGNTMWGESTLSGEKLLGAPGQNNLGTVQSGALEASNVDLSKQLVRLIVAQQSYQANAQTISTEDKVIQTLLNLR